jgi:hypothetical protein
MPAFLFVDFVYILCNNVLRIKEIYGKQKLICTYE